MNQDVAAGRSGSAAPRSTAETIQLGFVLPAVLIPALVPQIVWWPIALAPLMLGYWGLSRRLPELRKAPFWLRAGRLDLSIAAVTGVVTAISWLILFGWSTSSHPDFSAHLARIPESAPAVLALTGFSFALINATIEETAFRGLLLTLIRERYGAVIAISAQAAMFGIGHFAGVPSGWVGVALATLYGLALGVIRQWAGGIAACILSHIVLDATIFALVLGSAR